MWRRRHKNLSPRFALTDDTAINASSALAAPAASSGTLERYQVKYLRVTACSHKLAAAHASAAHLIFPLPAFVCQVPRVPVCFAHLCQTEGSSSSASAVTPAQHFSDGSRQTSLNPIFNRRRAHLPPPGVLHSLSQ